MTREAFQPRIRSARRSCQFGRRFQFPSPSHNCRRLSSYQPAACRPVFPRDWLPLVTAHCYGPGGAEKPKWQGTHQNPVVAGAAGAAIPASLSRGYRPPNVQKPGWWDHRQISSRCLWLIKAMYPRESMAVVPRVRFELTPEKPGNLRWWSGVGTATMSRSHVDQ